MHADQFELRSDQNNKLIAQTITEMDTKFTKKGLRNFIMHALILVLRRIQNNIYEYNIYI